MNILYEEITVAKSKEVKTRWFNSRKIWQNLLRKVMAQKRDVLAMIVKMKMMITIIMEFITG
jgi:hypothetical protein